MTSQQRKNNFTERLEFLGGLAAGLAHEIKNPLSTININLQLLKEDWHNARTQKEQRTLKKIDLLLREVKRLDGIVNDFLKLSRGYDLAPRDVQLNDLLQELLDLQEAEAQRAKVTVRFARHASLPTVYIDPEVFKQAMVNLFGNAIDAMAGGGELLVATACTADDIKITITDTGSGILPEHLEKIFNPYFSTKKGGTGIGLPTVKRIVQEHGGTVQVVSEVGKGTAFTITLPRRSPLKKKE